MDKNVYENDKEILKSVSFQISDGLFDFLEKEGDGKAVLNFENLGEQSIYRPTPIVRSILSVLPFIVQYPKHITVNLNDVRIYSAISVLASITNQEFISNIDNPPGIANITLLTSVQYPYVLEFSSITSQQVGLTIDYINSNNNCPTSSTCTQNWYFNIIPDKNMCNIDGLYTFNFTLICQTTNCPLDSSTNTGYIEFLLQSSNICPEIVETIDLTGSMTSYEEIQHLNIKDDFLPHQTIYFEVDVNSTKATITSSTISYFSVILWNNVEVILYQNNANTLSGNNVAFSITPGVYSCYSQLNVIPQIFPVPQDQSQNVEFHAIVDVQFFNTAKKRNEESTQSFTFNSNTISLSSGQTIPTDLGTYLKVSLSIIFLILLLA